MIRYFPPYVTTSTHLNQDDLRHHSRLVHDPLGFDPSILITSNFDAVAHGPLLKGGNNTSYGRLFEICWWNALVIYGVDPDSIECGVDITRGKHAEIDLLVHTRMGDVALLLKTSLRERWKQLDRDANAIRFSDIGGRLETWTVFYREHGNDTPERMIKHAQRIECMFFTGGVRVHTVLDAVAMRALFIRCGARSPEDVADSMFATPDKGMLL